MGEKRDLISILDVKDDLVGLLELAASIKNRTKAGEPYEPLRGKSLAMIFEKASTRTRVSFEVGMTQLGGHALFLSPSDLQLGRGETIADTARVLSRYVDGIMYRAFRRENVLELARNASVPVINGLDDKEHPCQVIADLFTILEHKGSFKELKLAYVGDGNNVCNSILLEHAKKDAVVMHCLPAHRGLEITDEVIDGPLSIVFDQAENRLHAQKAILSRLLAGV